MPAYGSQNWVEHIQPGSLPYAFWSAENPLTGTASVPVALTGRHMVNPGAIKIELFFSATPGAFTIDVEEADTETANAYQKIGGATLTLIGASGSGFYARIDIATVAYAGKYIRLLSTLQNANSVNVTAKISVQGA